MKTYTEIKNEHPFWIIKPLNHRPGDIMNCANCGKTMAYIGSYSSVTCFTDDGTIALLICPKCFEEETHDTDDASSTFHYYQTSDEDDDWDEDDIAIRPSRTEDVNSFCDDYELYLTARRLWSKDN